MPVYAIAQISITDRSRYERYQARFFEVFRQFRGTLLAADEKPWVVEGRWSHEKAILLEFPDADDFEEWFNSPAYREIARDREAGSEGVVLLVKGRNGT